MLRFMWFPTNRSAMKLMSTSIHDAVVYKHEEKIIKPWKKIPGPLSLPIIGQLLHFLPGGWLYKRTMELQTLLYNNYGPIVRLDGNFGFDPIIFIFDPEAAMQLFRKEDPVPNRPGFESILYHRKNYYNKSEDDPCGLILGVGESWRKMRNSVNPVLMTPKTIKQYANVMADVSDDMILRLKQIRNRENKLEGNLYAELNLWALESVGVVALGARLNCFDSNLPDDSPVKKLITTIHDVLATSERLDFQPSLWRYIPTPAFKKAMKLYDTQLKLNEYFIDKARNDLKMRGESISNEEKSILEKLLDIDRKIAVAMANDMLFGGIDPTANTILGLLYLLAVNQDKQEKLRDEVLLKREKCTYLTACIKDTLRIFPLVGGNFRRTTKEHDVLGYRIPKDMNIIVGNQHLCLMEEQFPRPTEFIPERWTVDKSDPLYYGNAHPFSYAPFGFGARGCVGRRFAALEMETFMSKMLQNFRVEWFGPPPKRERASCLVYFPGPYNFIFRDLEN